MMRPSGKAFAIKGRDPRSSGGLFSIDGTEDDVRGKHISEGDTIFVSEAEGGEGLFARGIVTSVERIAKRPDVERQTPRVSLAIRYTAPAKRPLWRSELKSFTNGQDGRPETKLNFKFYRQATNKIAGITAVAAA